MLADVHVATPQPKKSVSSVQIGQPRASAGREDGPVFGIACAEPLPRFGLEVAVEILTDNRAKRGHGPQRGKSFFRDRHRV